VSEVWHVYATSEHGRSGLLAPGVRAKRYGQAITGRPCVAAYLHDPPRNAQDVAWIASYLPMYMAPGAKIHHIYTHYSDSGQEK